ncbi:MAG: NYN domain-containing protein [Defluviitaleaceae bacterium]|nr:NYN domain-containing protein [Defluviitaleaceae bacterium]
MIEYLLVDGYNIIFAWTVLIDLANDSLENARLKLLELLSNYQGFTDIKIIVVFDAHKVKDNTGLEYQDNNISVVYTKENESADMYIEKMVLGFSKKHKVRVATNDSLEQTMIMGRGAYRISVKELYLEITEANKKIQENYTKKRPIKNNTLLDNVDEKTRRWLLKMRLEKGD